MAISRTAVLVVDDNPSNRELLVRHLSRQEFAVLGVPDGEAALEAIGTRRFDMVMLDMEMPGLAGLDVLRRLRERHSASDLPVVMVSGRRDSESIVAAL